MLLLRGDVCTARPATGLRRRPLSRGTVSTVASAASQRCRHKTRSRQGSCLFVLRQQLIYRHIARLTEHIYQQHVLKLPYRCAMCNTAYGVSTSHKCTAGDEQSTARWTHRCVRCCWRFKIAQDSVRHHKENGKTHVIQCLNCDGICHSAEEIVQHARKETTRSSPMVLELHTATGAVEETKQSEQRVCCLCNRYFRGKAGLRVHMHTHASGRQIGS